MRFGARLFRDQRVGGLLHSVVNELVGTIEPLDQLLAQRLPESRVHLLLGHSQNHRRALRRRRRCRGTRAAATRLACRAEAASASRPGDRRHCPCSVWHGCRRGPRTIAPACGRRRGGPHRRAREETGSRKTDCRRSLRAQALPALRPVARRSEANRRQGVPHLGPSAGQA